MKKIILAVIAIMVSGLCFSNTKVTLEIIGSKANGTNLYISVFNSEKSYKERSFCYSTKVSAEDNITYVEIELPAGEYLFSIFQDINKNMKCDSNLIGIPKEPVGITKYDGKGAPGNFNKHKVNIGTESKKISIKLHKL